MKLATYRMNCEAAARLGVLVDGYVVDMERLGRKAGLDLPSRMLDFIDLGPAAVSAVSEVLQAKGYALPVGAAYPIANVRLLAPIPRPRKNIFGIGLNYVKHVAESSRRLDTAQELPEKPVVFSKPPTTVIGPDDPVIHDEEMTRQLDWEVELAVIIGTRASHVRKGNALAHVFGYSLMIDISARDNRRAGQWIFSKGMDSYAPFGPCIVTADEIADPQSLDLWLTVDGVEKQRSNTRHMLFDVPHLIADISTGITLEPGDVIATGTPEGVGAGREPPEWLQAGDIIQSGIEGIGTMFNPVVRSRRHQS
jgi:2-keto-4-pentenoate hydratase/2-oxohepta-3-ene-1,7-dioic acid hydratase in catechol pathway